MSARQRRLLPLCPAPGRTRTAGYGPPSGSASHPADATAVAGAKAARLAAALQAGLPVLPGWVVPAAESRAAVQAAAAMLRGGQFAAARRAVLSRPLDADLAADLSEAAAGLGGRVIVRSSSKLESDPRWSGAFSSVADVHADEAATALRSCWASAFAVDPLARLDACGLQLEDLELGALIQPEISPAAGGVARVTSPDGRVEVTVEGVVGHPRALLSGWSDGARAHLTLLPSGSTVTRGPLLDLVGRDVVLGVARLAEGARRLLGDDTIEWAVEDGVVWLLQCSRATPTPHTTPTPHASAAPHTTPAPGPHLAAREWMPLLGAAVREHGYHLRGRPAVAGEAAGRLVACRPQERPQAACRDAILFIDRPLPALAPLLFTARGVIARSGASGSHLAEVARSLAVPMVTGCQPEAVARGHPLASGWLAAIDGGTGDVALFRGDGGDPNDGRETRHG
jgi:pyruvate, water dikinase